MSCARDEAMDSELDPSLNPFPKKNRQEIINDLAKQLKEKLNDEISVRISVEDNRKAVTAKVLGLSESAPISGSYDDLVYINRAGENAVDKLMRNLADLYVTISELLQ